MSVAVVRLLVSVDEASAMLSVRRTTLYRLMEQGELERCKIGARTLVTVSSIEAYVDRLAGASR